MPALYHPIHFKASVLICNPLPWKGGQAFALGKKPLVVKVSDTRDIRLEDPPSKIQTSLIRPDMLKCVSHGSLSTQYGSGLNAGSTEVAHMALTAANGIAQTARLCCINLFVDVSNAFAAIEKALMHDNSFSRTRMQRELFEAGFDQSTIDDACMRYADSNFWREH